MTTPFVQQNSYTKEELLACGRGELFGAGNAQLPLPNMLMIDRSTSTAPAANTAKAKSSPNWTSTPICGSSAAISRATPSCPAAWAWTPCGN